MKFLLVILMTFFTGNACIFAASGDLEYLLSREYENAGTWKERVLNLVERRVETEDYIKFIEVPENKYLEEVLLVQYKTISSSARLFEETEFQRKHSRYRNAVEFTSPLYYKYLTALDYFLKLEFIGILCHPENEIAEEELLALLTLLWTKIYQEQTLKENIYEKTKQELSEISKPYFERIRGTKYEVRVSEETQMLEIRREKIRLKFVRLLSIENFSRGDLNLVKYATIKCAAKICENTPHMFFEFLEKSGFLEKILETKEPDKCLRHLIVVSGASRYAKNILRYFEDRRFQRKIPAASP